jgi:hypothetical protein
MKSYLPCLAAALIIPALSPTHASPAPITLTVKSYRSLTNALVQTIDTAAPGTGTGIAELLKAQLGTPELKGVNLDQPWQIALWADHLGGQPNMSVWIPVTSFNEFNQGLQPNSLLKGSFNPNPITQQGNYAAIWIAGTSTSSTAETGHAAWKPENLTPPQDALELQIAPGEPLREQLLQGVAMVRMTMTSTFSSPQAQVPGVDAKALADLMGLYLDVFETALKGMNQFNLGLDVRNQHIELRSQLTARPGSDLASWLQDGTASLDSILPYALTPAPISFAVRWNGSQGFMPTLKKLSRLSLQVQGIPADSDAAKETDRLLDIMVPFKAGGIISLEPTLAFAGVYEFPNRDLKEIYGLMQSYLDVTMQSQVGETKPYKRIEFKQRQREVAGTPVDRVTMEFNFDAPMFQMPGQREMIESLWPGGRLEFDYATRGDRLFFASPDLFDATLTRTPTPAAPPAGISQYTVAYATVNVVQLLPAALRNNPMVPDQLKQQLGKLDPKGTELNLRVNLDGTLATQTSIPLKLISSLRQLAP